MNTLPDVRVAHGELLSDATISAEQMAKLNQARATFRELQSILLGQIVPSLDGGWNNPLATQIECRLESITFDTCNFFWKHRHAGAAHDALRVGGDQ